MVRNNKKLSRGLEIVLAEAILLGIFGPIAGLESNIRPFDRKRAKDLSFESYLEQGKEQYGEGITAYALALWTYPGAKLGAAIHNYGLPENSD